VVPVARKRRTPLQGCLTLIVGLVVVGVLINAVKGSHHTAPVMAAAVIDRTDGAFVRSGCFGCTNTAKILTSNTYCGWDGSNVVVHVTFQNTSVQTLTVSWHPSYLIANGTSHGGGLASIQDTKVQAGQTLGVFVKQSPKGTSADTPISKCFPSFQNVSAG
jgi:cephalosporin hydroxylase